jgi:ABC-2 type transport system ATP-binding protein
VRDLSFEVASGEVFGLIGPNGAGKSSTIRVLATIQEPTYGDVRIAGRDVVTETARAREAVGYMPDLAPVDDKLRCWEFLDLFAAAYGMPRQRRRVRVDEVLDEVGLGEKRDSKSGTLSRGMKQRLVLAKTVLTEPSVLLLDEPASGLDPMARIQLRDMLKRQAEMGRTVLISSHILSELSGFCTSIGIMEKGRMVVSGRLEDIVRDMHTGRRVVVEFLASSLDAAAIAAGCVGVTRVVEDRNLLMMDLDGGDEEAAALLRELVGKGVLVIGFKEEKPDIESILLRVGAKEVS